MKKRNTLPTLLSCLLLATAPLFASRPAWWTISSGADFSAGDFDGVALTSDGNLSLGPGLEELLDTGEALIHAMAADRAGNIFVATGGSGKVFRVSPRGSGEEWARLDETGVFALAVDSLDRVYAGTGPNGKVYRLGSQGQADIYFNPQEKYVWDLAVDSENQVFVATGPNGIIYKVDAQGRGSVFFDSPESHIVSLEWAPDGSLLAGSAQGGIIYRISKSGQAFALFDSPLEEIKALRSDRYGNVFAAALSWEPASSTEVDKKDDAAVAKPTSSAPKAEPGHETVEIEGIKKGKKLEVYRIDQSGAVETLYSADSESIFDLLVRSDGALIAGTGNKGRLIAVTQQRLLRVLAQSPSEQVTGLLEIGGNLYAAASNLGKVYRVLGSPAQKASYESKPLDAGMPAKWGAIRWQTLRDAGEGWLKLFTRSGNTEKPDSSWSDWSEAYSNQNGELVKSPAARYLQWKAELSRAGESSALSGSVPALARVDVSYLQFNMPPQITKLTLHAPGSAFIATPAAPPPGGGAVGGPDKAYFLSLPEPIRKLDEPFVVPPREVFIGGARSLSWSAEDSNGDDLVFAVFLREVGSSEWKLIRDNIREKYFTLDGASLAEGSYEFRVVASDRLSNPPGEVRQGEIISPSFTHSTQLPALDVRPEVQGNSLRASITARSSTGPLFQLEYSMNGQDWFIAYPSDGITDGLEESYEIRIQDLSRGDHLLWVRIVDSLGNLGTGRAGFSIR